MSAESLLSVIASVPTVGMTAVASADQADAPAFEGVLAEALAGEPAAQPAPVEDADASVIAVPTPVIAVPQPVMLSIMAEAAPVADVASRVQGTAPVPGTESDFAKVLEDHAGPQIQPDPTVETTLEICPAPGAPGKNADGGGETPPAPPVPQDGGFTPPLVPFKFAARGLPATGEIQPPAQTFPPPAETTSKNSGRKDGREILPDVGAPSNHEAIAESSGSVSAGVVVQAQPDASQGSVQPEAASLKPALALPVEASAKLAAPAPQSTPAAPAEAAGAPNTEQPTASLTTLSRATVETTAHIAAQIIRKLEGRSTRFEMALTPDGLGRVDVSLDIDADGQLAARLAFDNPIAAMDLRGRVDELRRQLEDQGFKLADDALQFTDRDPQGRGDGFDGRRERAFARSNRLANDADLEISAPVVSRWMSLSLTPDRVDLKV